MMRLTVYKTLLDPTGHASLVTEKTVNYTQLTVADTPDKIYDVMDHLFDLPRCTEEYVYMMCFNTKMRLLGIFEIAHGQVNKCIYSNREIFQKALLSNASCIIFIHNHPSGDPLPSNEDLQQHKRLKNAADVIGIELLDNIIIGNGCHYSYMEHGIV